MHASQIAKVFPTDRYKQFFYFNRPFFTLFTGLFLSALGFVGILPLSTAVYLAAILAFDDLPITPILSLVTAANNLVN